MTTTEIWTENYSKSNQISDAPGREQPDYDRNT